MPIVLPIRSLFFKKDFKEIFFRSSGCHVLFHFLKYAETLLYPDAYTEPVAAFDVCLITGGVACGKGD